jgi:hypothetical protein
VPLSDAFKDREGDGGADRGRDVNQLGYAQVATNAAGFLGAFAVLGSTVVGTDQVVSRMSRLTGI